MRPFALPNVATFVPLGLFHKVRRRDRRPTMLWTVAIHDGKEAVTDVAADTVSVELQWFCPTAIGTAFGLPIVGGRTKVLEVTDFSALPIIAIANVLIVL